MYNFASEEQFNLFLDFYNRMSMRSVNSIKDEEKTRLLVNFKMFYRIWWDNEDLREAYEQTENGILEFILQQFN